MRILSMLIIVTLTLSAQGQFSSLVNPFIGTDGHGHTFPGATAPFGMVQLSPDTRVEGWDACGGYHYSDSTILGFTHTHLSGTGVPDYGDILLMPMVKNPSLDPKKYRSSFSHKNEFAGAGFYHVVLDNGLIDVDLTATTRVGVHRYRFRRTDSAFVIIDLHHGLGPDVVIESQMEKNGTTEISGYRHSRGWAQNQRLYFVAQFSLPIRSISVTNNDSIMWNTTHANGTNVKAALLFNTKKKQELIVKVALSSVSADGARKNLLAEARGWDVESITKNTAKQWNNELSKISVYGGTKDQQTVFYTALYHSMIAPNTYSDADGRFRGMDNAIHTSLSGTRFTVFSLWDTFRALHPLMTIIDEKRTVDFINTFLSQYEENGLLPVWELSSNETYCMIGYHSVSVIADAIAKNIPGIDKEKALAAMINSAEKDHFGLKSYREHGYVLGEKESESVSKTLEYAYDDWCIARTAESLGKKDIAERFYRRSQNYRNVFDPSSGFMRGKKNGMWNSPFTPASVSLDFTEANSWQYSFFVPQDIGGMMELYGGREKFIGKLDELFSTESKLEGRQQSDITGLIGQYAHGNEPSHHMAYLFTYAGAPAKTQERTRQILNEMYSNRPDGLSGNEDCGQMSAWFVMSAMGLYQVTPGNPEYTMTAPLFDSVKIRLSNKKEFVITSKRHSPDDRYILSAQKNGSPLKELFISHNDIVNGAAIHLELGAAPSTTFDQVKNGLAPLNIPFTAVPYFSSVGTSFRDSAVITLNTTENDANILYSINNGTSLPYHAPFTITERTRIAATAVKNGISSAPIEAEFIKSESPGTITLKTKYSDQYTAGGNEGLVDGIFGIEDFRVGHWQGYEQNDLDAVIDLGSIKQISSVTARFLQDNNAWIFFPQTIEYSISTDGITYETIFSGTTGVAPQQEGAMIKAVSRNITKPTRFIRVRAANIGLCPSWHKGSGNKAWLFADEIVIL
ncbi:MAG: GH92 family glycosyl hydrolase [Bacteroidota bacterium]